MPVQRSRSFCFTYNNPTHSGDAFRDALIALPHVRYFVFQLERGESGTPHYQGYIEFKENVTWTALRRVAPMHVEKRQGTRAQAREYCMSTDKDGEVLSPPCEWGQWELAQGRRSDLAEVAQAVLDGTSLVTIAREHPSTFVRNHRGLAMLAHFSPRNPRTPPRVTLLFGPSGCGKSALVHESTATDGLYVKPGDDKWWDGYSSHKSVLMDDFAGRASKVSLTMLLTWLDRYPVLVPFKGGYARLEAEHIYITTNIHPIHWYDYARRQTQYHGLARRIHSVITFGEGYVPLLLDHSAFFRLPMGPYVLDDGSPDPEALVVVPGPLFFQ